MKHGEERGFALELWGRLGLPGALDRLQAVLVGIEDEQLLSALPRKRLIPAANEEFSGIEAVARELGMVR